MQRSKIEERENGLYKVSENKHLGVKFDDSATDVTHSPVKNRNRRYQDKGDFRKVLIKLLSDTNQVETQINEPVSYDTAAINRLNRTSMILKTNSVVLNYPPSKTKQSNKR